MLDKRIWFTLIFLLSSSALAEASMVRSLGEARMFSELRPTGTEVVDYGGSLSGPRRGPANENDKNGEGRENYLSGDDDFSAFEDEYGQEARQSSVPIYDPWIGYNRTMFRFNDWMFEKLLRPMVKGYNFILPEKVRISLSKFFHNLFFPLRFVNNVLQLKIKGAAVETGRFIVNTTFGIGGIFDPADHYFGWMPHNEDFGQTLAYWGVGPGPVFVIPFLGMSNLRDTIGILPDYLTHPVYHIYGSEEYMGVRTVDYFNFASLHYEEYESIKKDALDPYTYVRDAYSQNREKQIAD